jgi:hypothetical protein
MKNILLLICLMASPLMAQNIEVLLIGTSHDYSKNPPQDFSNIHQTIRAFKPDAFFGEFRSVEDEKQLMDYWCKSFNNERIARLRQLRNTPEAALPKIISDLKIKLERDPNDWKSRVDIVHAYYLNQDVANAYCQNWLIFHNKNKPIDSTAFDYLKLILEPKVTSVKQAIKQYSQSEYHYIAFPMMQEMGFKEIYPMDCQVYDLNYQVSDSLLFTKYDALKKDSINCFTTAFKKLEAEMEAGYAKDKEMDKSNTHLTEWINTDEANKLAASFDYFLPEMYDLPCFPREELRSKLHWWNMRNEGMCENTVVRARKLGVKRIVVLAGGSHRKPMQEIFQKMPNVKVWNINEFGK